MPKYIIEVSQEWTEHGSVEVDADSEDEARETGMGLLLDGDDSIQWEASNMEPGNMRVESVKEIEG